jgi:hypothetical protein
MQQNLLFTAISIAVAVGAISNSVRKWRAFLIILASAVGCFAIGTAVGFIFWTPEAAGSLAALLARVGIIAASVQQIALNRRGKGRAQGAGSGP